MSAEARLGIDFGGVIVPLQDRTRGPDTQLSENDLTLAPLPGAMEAIRELVAAFQGLVWIVSKAGPRMSERTKTWLEASDFHARTGLLRERVLFCRERADKRTLCSELGITHFVDDRIHVMQILRGGVEHLFLFGDRPGNPGTGRWARSVRDWPEALPAVLATLCR